MHTLLLSLDLPLRPGQLSQLAGAVAASAGWQDDLFHNHKPDQEEEQTKAYHHRYPRIHYRVRHRNAQIWAIGEGVEALKRWLQDIPEELRIGARVHPLRVTGIREMSEEVHITASPVLYRLMDYLPFNHPNYQKWQGAPHLTARIALLEGAILGHILGFVQSMDQELSGKLEVHAMSIRQMKELRVHGRPRMGFNLVYRANIILPSGLALGHGVSRGFGVQQRIGQD